MMNRLNSHPLSAFFRQDRFYLSDEQIDFCLCLDPYLCPVCAGFLCKSVGANWRCTCCYPPCWNKHCHGWGGLFSQRFARAISADAVLGDLVWYRSSCDPHSYTEVPTLSRNSLALVVFLAIFTYAYAFGTNENLWAGASPASLFWVLSGFVVSASLAAESGSWRKLLPLVAITLLVSTVILYLAMENPYRQLRSLRLQTSAVEINRERATLFLTDGSASYVRELYRLASENGFKAGDPMLDLTGVSSGVLYAIGARPLGVASAFGGYPGSSDFVRAGLDQVSCGAIGLSWILTEPGSPQYFASDLLERYEIKVTHEFSVVDTINSNSSRFIKTQK